jgi:hypothetical protein
MNSSRYVIIVIALMSASALAAGCGNNKGGKLTQITIAPDQQVIATGTRQQYTSIALFGDGTIVNWTSATNWSTSNESSVAISNSFDSYGLAQSISSQPGTTVIITGKDLANNVVSTVTLSVVDPVNIFISPNNPYMKKGQTYNFKTKAKLNSDPTGTLQDLTPYSYATPTPYSYVTWTTTDPSVAKVSRDGLVTILATSGTRTTGVVSSYTFSSLSSGGTDSRTFTTMITVTEDSLKSLTLSSDVTFTNIISLATTSVVHFTATAAFLVSNTTSTYPVDFTESAKWTSSKKGVATISDEPLSKGTCTLYPPGGVVTIKAMDPITGHAAEQTFKITP